MDEILHPARSLAPKFDQDRAVAIPKVLLLLSREGALELDDERAVLQRLGQRLDAGKGDRREGRELVRHPPAILRRHVYDDVCAFPIVTTVEDREEFRVLILGNDVVGLVEEQGGVHRVDGAKNRGRRDRGGHQCAGHQAFEAFECSGLSAALRGALDG